MICPKIPSYSLGYKLGLQTLPGTSDQSAEPLGPHGWSPNLTGLAAAIVPTALKTYPSRLQSFRYRSYPPRSHSPLTPTFLSSEVLE